VYSLIVGLNELEQILFKEASNELQMDSLSQTSFILMNLKNTIFSEKLFGTFDYQRY